MPERPTQAPPLDVANARRSPSYGCACAPRLGAFGRAARAHCICAHPQSLTARLHVWRHPKPQGVAGRCIGARSDVPVDARKAKRLAHRIRQLARRELGPREVFTSPLRRSHAVGQWLRRWGWQHHVDARLSELDFGHWDGLPWDQIGAPALDSWCADFAHHAPGGGEPVAALLARCAAFLQPAPVPLMPSVRYAVAHAGWINAARWLQANTTLPSAAVWPLPVPYGARVCL